VLGRLCIKSHVDDIRRIIARRVNIHTLSLIGARWTRRYYFLYIDVYQTKSSKKCERHEGRIAITQRVKLENY
jgi:hypothetical protein